MTPKFTFWLIVLLSALKILTIIEMSRFRPFDDGLRVMSPGAAIVGIILFSSTLIFGLYGLWQYHKLEKESKGGG